MLRNTSLLRQPLRANAELSSLRDAPSRSLEWVVGDRCQIITPKKYSGEKGYVCGFHADDSPEIWVKLDNHDLQIRVNPDEARFLEEKQSLFKVGDRTLNNALIQEIRGEAFRALWDNGYSNWYAIADLEDGYAKMPIAIDITDLYKQEEGAMSTTTPKENAECNNSHNLTSAQELEPVFALQVYNSDSSLSEPQKLTNTAQVSSNCDIPTYTTTETCEIYQDLQNTELGIICTQEDSTLLQLPHPAPHSLQKANAGEVQTSVIASPQSSKSSENCNLDSQPLKMSQDLSPAPIIQDSPRVHISEEWSEPLTSSGTMRNGWLSEAATLPAPTLESEYCWLRSPGALSLSGKGRPPGQTKQEAELKRLGLINKGEVLNPAILCQWYEIPDSWLDPLECRAATELLEECDRQQEIFSILELQRSPLIESSTSTLCVESQPPVTRANAQPETYIINQSQSLGKVIDNLGFGFTVNWLDSSDLVTYNWERDDQQIIGFALAQPAAGIAPQHLIDRFLEEKSKCQVIPENFLEETKEDTKRSPSSKRRQRKGCLYKYLENKKLKDGSIASYPRVIGHRHPDNPTHWRWGFNWEEKVDGEWKGRSIGSVPLGAIALIQSMQNEGVSLEEIIGFIKRAKAKK